MEFAIMLPVLALIFHLSFKFISVAHEGYKRQQTQYKLQIIREKMLIYTAQKARTSFRWEAGQFIPKPKKIDKWVYNESKITNTLSCPAMNCLNRGNNLLNPSAL